MHNSCAFTNTTRARDTNSIRAGRNCNSVQEAEHGMHRQLLRMRRPSAGDNMEWHLLQERPALLSRRS